jgi:K+-transporting ATPase KdpF subunit
VSPDSLAANAIAGALVLLLIVYLFIALIRPDKF